MVVRVDLGFARPKVTSYQFTPPALAAPVAPPRVPRLAEPSEAAAVDAAHTTPDMLASIVRALGQGARLVAPVTTPLPPGVRELARDAAEWVAETTTRASGLIELRRRASSE